MSDPGTVFESFDGSSPGTQPKSDDITGVPLQKYADSSDGDWPDTEAGRSHRGSTISSVPGSNGIQPEDEGSVGVQETDEREERKPRRTAEQRIRQLTRRYRSAEGRSSELETQLRDLQTQIKRQDETISSLRSARPSRSTREASSYEDYSSSPEGGDRGGFDPDVIRKVVAESIAPIAERIERTERQNQLQQEQQSSFAEAVQELPELQDANSEEARYFNELWGSSRLREDPDGPLHIAMIVKGALSDDRRDRPSREARKRAASVVTPGPRNPEVQPPHVHAGKKVFTEGMSRLREGDDDPDTYIATRKAQRRFMRRTELR